jgi:hypothetical protein
LRNNFWTEEHHSPLVFVRLLSQGLQAGFKVARVEVEEAAAGR